MVVIIDYGMGNVGSVRNALEVLGYDVVISSSEENISRADHLILPGVGAFGDGMKNLQKANLVEILTKEVLVNKKPILGICLGMQMMATSGEEGGVYSGLGWISGVTRKFELDESTFKVPHVGWNDVKNLRQSTLLQNIQNPIFYFVHSYHLVPEDKNVAIGVTDYGEEFVSVVEKGNIFGVQFHPEKSQKAGLDLLNNFLQYGK